MSLTLPGTARKFLKSGNDLARRYEPEHAQKRNLTIQLPYRGLLLVLGRADVNDFDTEGFLGTFDQMQVVFPRVQANGAPDQIIMVSAGVGVDPRQHPLRTRPPGHMRYPLAVGQISMASMASGEENNMLIENGPADALAMIPNIVSRLEHLVEQNNVQ